MQKKTIFQIAFTTIFAYSSLKTVHFLQEQESWLSIELLILIMLIILTLWLYGKAFGRVIITDKWLGIILGTFGAVFLLYDLNSLL